jgi:hypothetical protein
MGDVCRSVNNLVKCGDKILTHCLRRRNVDDINDDILYNMKKFLDSYKVAGALQSFGVAFLFTR